MTTPPSLWIVFHLFILLLLTAELVYARRARHQLPTDATPEQQTATTRRTSIVATVGWFITALLVALFVFLHSGPQPATEFLAGYSIEQALSVDNLFLFLLLFRSFGILPSNQPRILFWGVAGAIVMRGAFIAAGIGLLEHVHWISYVFGAILLVAAVRLVLPKDPEAEQQTPSWLRWLSRLHPISLRQDHFFVREDNRRMATVLFLALLAIEITDVVFALDSIPAVLSITRTPFLAYTSNILAVMGLRSLFFLLAHLLERVRYLHLGLAAILAFAALKMLSAPWLSIGPLLSLGIIAGVLLVTFVLSSGTNPQSKAAL